MDENKWNIHEIPVVHCQQTHMQNVARIYHNGRSHIWHVYITMVIQLAMANKIETEQSQRIGERRQRKKESEQATKGGRRSRIEDMNIKV